MIDDRIVWLPYPPDGIVGLPKGLAYQHWDGSPDYPGDPAHVQFLVGPTAPGAEKSLRDLLLRTHGLEVLQLLSSGWEHIAPLMDGLPWGAQVSTARGVHREATAELAVALLLALARGIDDFVRRQAAGEWKHGTWRTLFGKRVLVVGHGSVGAAVAARLRPFGCEVVSVARTARATAEGRVHGAAELTALLPTVGAVVLCTPLTEETRGLLNADTLALLADGSLVVNVGRGELVNTEALTREVASGRLRAALDVTDPEPLPPGHALWGLPDALITPHVAAFTDEFHRMTERYLVEQLRRFDRREPIANVVFTAHDRAVNHTGGHGLRNEGGRRNARVA